MVSYQFDHEIDAPPATVFGALTDQSRLPEWSPEVVRSEVVGGGPVRAGSTLKQVRWQVGREVVSVLTVEIHDPPHRHKVETTILGVDARFTFELEPASAVRTRVRLTGELAGAGFGRILEWPLMWLVRRADAPALGRLAKVVEER